MLLHLSDLHFGTEQPEACRGIQELCARLSPEGVVVSGDLTQRAKPQEFAAARKFLESLNVPYIVVPGNHDIPLFDVVRRAVSPFYYFKKYFGEVETSLETSHFFITTVNTIRPLRHTQGTITLAQIERTASLLTQARADKCKLVVSHQPFGIRRPSDKHDVPRHMPEAVRQWAKAGATLFLHGHFHASAVFDLKQSFGLNVAQPVLDVQVGTSLSHRLRHDFPNMANVIHPDLTIERYDFKTEHMAFMTQGVVPVQLSLV